MLRIALRSTAPRPGRSRGLPERRAELVGRDRRRADLRDPDAGSVVRERRRLLERAAGPEDERARRQHRVARAGYVEHLAGHGRELLDAAAALEERHPLLAARHEDRVRVPARQQALAGGAQGRAVADLDARGLRRLLAVRLHERGPAIVREVRALRVDDPDERLAFACRRERVQEIGTDRTLRVIRHDDDVEPPAMPEDEVADASRARAVGSARGLAVETDDLLLVRDDAGLFDRRSVARDDHAGRVRADRAERLDEAAPRPVVAD